MSQSGAGGVSYRGNMAAANTDRSPSPAIWSRVPWSEIKAGTVPGYVDFDDFDSLPLVGTQTTQIGYDRYKVFSSASLTVVPVSAINSVEMPGSFLSLGGDTDNDAASIADAYPMVLMDGAKTYTQRICFEARVAINSILTNTQGWFLGLAETDQWTLSATVPFNAASASINNSASAIGFFKDEDGLGVIQSVVSDRATSFTAISATAASYAANTFIKLGFIYDVGKSADCITFFADGVPLSTYYSATSLLATTNLKANALGRIFAIITDSAGTATLSYMDWWKLSAEFNF